MAFMVSVIEAGPIGLVGYVWVLRDGFDKPVLFGPSIDGNQVIIEVVTFIFRLIPLLVCLAKQVTIGPIVSLNTRAVVGIVVDHTVTVLVLTIAVFFGPGVNVVIVVIAVPSLKGPTVG
jgi:hypothetical protein